MITVIEVKSEEELEAAFKLLLETNDFTMVPVGGLEPPRREASDFESDVSTNSTTRATMSDITEEFEDSNTENDKTTLPHDTRSKVAVSLANRVAGLRSKLDLPNGWNVHIDITYGWSVYIQIEDRNAVCNLTGKALDVWRGRKWLLSSHMTDGEIVQTIFMATLTAAEHEIRETFKFKGQDIFNGHFDLDKLVELRASKGSLKVRKEAA